MIHITTNNQTPVAAPPLVAPPRKSGRKPNEIRNHFEIVEERPGNHPIVVCKFCKANNVPELARISSRVRNLRSHLKSCIFYNGPAILETTKKLKLGPDAPPKTITEEIVSKTIKVMSFCTLCSSEVFGFHPNLFV